MHETEKLVDLLKETLRSVNHELAALEAVPTRRIASYIRQTEQKIEINDKRMEVNHRHAPVSAFSPRVAPVVAAP